MSQTWDMSGNDLVVSSVSLDGTNSSSPFNVSIPLTEAGSSANGANIVSTTEVTLGTYANSINGKLDFGTAGAVTGLGGAICAEIDLGPGTTAGSYACFEAEMILPTSASTGTRSSFMTMNASGAAVATFDTNGFLFDVNGLTPNTGKLFRTGLSQAVTASARLRVQVGGTSYYIPLCVNEALTS